MAPAKLALGIALRACARPSHKKALINTTTGYPLAGLRRVNLIPDPEHSNEVLSLANARAVVYWARPVPGDDPRVVGVQVRTDGAASVFFGIVTPP